MTKFPYKIQNSEHKYYVEAENQQKADQIFEKLFPTLIKK